LKVLLEWPELAGWSLSPPILARGSRVDPGRWRTAAIRRISKGAVSRVDV